jgi:hypothetical protein
VTTLCLTDEGYGFVDTEVCTAGDRAQQWVESVGQSVVPPNVQYTQRVINVQSGQCLENDSYGEGYGNLHTAPCNNGSFSQGWYKAQFSTPTAADIPGSGSVKNFQTGLCLQSDISVSLDTGPLSGNAYAQQCTAWHWQYWTLPAS